jgi:hypothetical protein
MNNLQNGYLQFAFNEFLADCQVKVGDLVIPAHKVVLASNSIYFFEYFKEHSEGIVLLPQIKSSPLSSKSISEVFKQFLNYLYGGLDENLIVEFLDLESVFTFLALSIELKVYALQNVAEKFIVVDVLGIENGVKILKEGISLSSESLVLTCSYMITQYFETFCSDPELKKDLLTLPIEIITSILSSDDLSINHESSVYNFVLSYLSFKSQSNETLTEASISSLLSKVRWSHLSHSDLLSAANSSFLSQAKDLILEGLSAQLSRHESTSFIYKIETLPRKSLTKFFPNKSTPSLQNRDLHPEKNSKKSLKNIIKTQISSQDHSIQDEFRYQSDFDQNGLLFYLATQGCSEKWQNPHLTGQVRVFASSLSFGKLEDFVGRTGNSLRTGKDQPAFIGIDLGPERLFELAAYSIRNSVNTSYAFFNWKVEASVDRTRWKVVDKRIHFTGNKEVDRNMEMERNLLVRRAGTSTWAVSPAGGFRFFRIVCVGDNVSGTSNIGISCVEIYGKVVDGRAW